MLRSHRDSLRRIRCETFLCRVLCFAVIVGLTGACSPEQYKAQADKEVYQIIDGKWQDSLGHKSNYIVNDSNIPSSPEDIRIDLAVPASGVINLAHSIAIATAYNLQYQGH